MPTFSMTLAEAIAAIDRDINEAVQEPIKLDTEVVALPPPHTKASDISLGFRED